VNQAIAHRGLVETLPAVQPGRQPDFTPYLGTYARPNMQNVVRAENGKLYVDNRLVTFFGPDRVVVLDGPEAGQAIEFVRDSTGRVNWVRVTGRVAVKTP
jgi:hypothetical protein